jgi:hypothetical protein
MVAAGIYANLALVNHSPSEFVVDFIQLMPGVQQAKVRSRVILAPLHAKRVLSALQQNIANYEQQFGEIKEVEPYTSSNTKQLTVSEIVKLVSELPEYIKYTKGS